MKKTKAIVLTLFILLMAIPSWADWTLTPSKVSRTGHYIYWQVLCTSDGSALSATDILSSSYMDDTLLREIQGSTMMIMDVIPGTGGVAPDTTIDITWSNMLVDVYSHDTFSNVANTVGNNLAEDYNQYPAILSQLKLTLNDIGTAGDQVTLAILCWIE